MTFCLAGEDDLDALRGIDPDSDWRELARGERAWILQTDGTYERIVAGERDLYF